MGEQNVTGAAATQQMRRFTLNLLNDVRALEMMIEGGRFETGKPRLGAEQETFLVDSHWRPAPVAVEMLERLGDRHFTTELGKFNIEFNLDPIDLGGDCFRTLESQLKSLLAKMYAVAHEMGCEVLLVGILPTLRQEDLTLDNMTPKPRYRALNDAIKELRGGNFQFRIEGRDELIVEHDNVMLEACNTSFQLHLQVSPEEFPQRYNIAQLVAAPVLAAATNSPLLFGRQLWSETRIALFQQSVDTRGASEGVRDQPPRVSFGSRWIEESILEIFKEDISRFAVVISGNIAEDSVELVKSGKAPDLTALRIHNSTVYRWNRPCYGVADGKPHLRIENRVLPAGPTIVDEVANAAFWYGLMAGAFREYGDIAAQMEFATVAENFSHAARVGLAAQFHWPGVGEVPARQLILERLLPLARIGLQEYGVDSEDAERYLGVIHNRVDSGRTGSRWQIDSLAAMKTKRGRREGLGSLVAATAMRQVGGQPVHTWSIAEVGEAGDVERHFARVEQIMTTDLTTVREGESAKVAAHVMSWHDFLHLPVEDKDHKLAGVVSYRALLQLEAQGSAAEAEATPVRDVMDRDVPTVAPDTSLLEAARLMAEKRLGYLPVVTPDGRLAGVVTASDFLPVVVALLKQG